MQPGLDGGQHASTWSCLGELPYVEAIADRGLADAVTRDRTLARGVNVLAGKVTHEAVADAHNLDYAPLDDVLSLSV